MKFTVISLEFRNFMSYGNKDTVLHIGEPGVISITGKNGRGKSVNADALSMALYGKPYRKIKIKEILNWNNNSAAWLRVTFKVGMEDYRITRTISKSKSDIELHHKVEGKWKDIDLVSTSKLIQDEIDKLIGVQYETFKHIVAIGNSTTETKPFLAMPAGDKRKLIEGLFGLTSISLMNKVLKQDKSKVKTKLTLVESALELNRDSYKALSTQKVSTDQLLQDFEDNKRAFILDQELQQIEIISKIHKYKDVIEELNYVINEDEILKIKSSISEYETDNNQCSKNLGSCEALISHAKETIKTLQASDTCPICATSITEEHLSSEVNKLNSVIESNESQKSVLTEKVNSNNQSITDLKNKLNKISSIIRDISVAQTEVSKLESKVDSITGIIAAKNKEELVLNNAETLNNKLQSLKEDITLGEVEYKENAYKDKIIQIAEFLLSDEGIKTEFYNIVVPLFNTTVNDYLKKFGLDIAVIFNDVFDYEIHTMRHKDVNYFSFSQGERSRIDISILLTFIKLSKTIANWDCNLLLLDEVIDQNLDSDGLQLILESIKSIAEEEDLTAMVISHKLSDSNFIFDREIVVTKEGGYSKMEEI